MGRAKKVYLKGLLVGGLKLRPGPSTFRPYLAIKEMAEDEDARWKPVRGPRPAARADRFRVAVLRREGSAAADHRSHAPLMPA